MFRPLSDYILITPSDSTEEGFTISDEKAQTKKGIVIAIGPGRIENIGVISSKLKVGDTVYFTSFSEQAIRIENKAYLIIAEKEVFGYERPKEEASN